jgi:ATP-dependent DNA helicase RecG
MPAQQPTTCLPAAVSVWLQARSLPEDLDLIALTRVLYKAGLAADDQPVAHLTNLGVALLAGDVRDFLPQAGIVMIRQNPDGSSASHRVEVPLALAWPHVLAQLHAPDWFPTRDERGGEQRIEGVSDLPITAVREGVINGIAHRDYAKSEPVELLISPDEIRITSPGGPVRPVRIEDLRALKAKRALRNPALFQQMTTLRLVEQGSLGMDTFRNLPKTDRLPRPTFSEEDGVLTLTIYRSSEATAKAVAGIAPNLTKTELAGWAKISHLETVSTAEYMALADVAYRTAARHLRKFEGASLLTATKEGPQHRYRINR